MNNNTPSITEKVENLNTLRKRCEQLGEVYEISYLLRTDLWVVGFMNSEFVEAVPYHTANAMLNNAITRLTKKLDSPELSDVERRRLVDRFLDFVNNVRDKLETRVEQNWMMTDRHNFHLLPDYLSDSNLFFDVVKYYAVVENTPHWSIKIGTTMFHHKKGLEWKEIEKSLKELISKRIEEYPYEILSTYKVADADSFLMEIKRYYPPTQTPPPRKDVYKWLRIDGIRIEPLEFIERVLVRGSNDIDVRYFKGCTITSNGKSVELNISGTPPITYFHQLTPLFTEQGIRSRIKKYLSTLEPLTSHDLKTNQDTTV